MLELYLNNTSVCVSKVRFALEEKGLEWTGHFVDIFAGEQFRPEYLKLNPNAVIPTLVHDGIPLIESTLINEYIDDAFPEPTLRPADSRARHGMRLWTKQLDDSVHHSTSVVSYSIAYRFLQLSKPRAEIDRFLSGIPDPARRERQRDLIDNGIESRFFLGGLARFERLLGDIEAVLLGRPWLAGNEFSLADVGFAPYMARLERLQLTPMWSDRPRVADWFQRLKARPAYQKSIEQWYRKAGLPAKLLEEKGAEAWPRVKTHLEELRR